MDKKQIIGALAVLGVSLIIIFGGLAIVYYIDPTLIGIAPNKSTNLKSNTSKNKLNRTPTVEITLERALELENLEKLYKKNIDSLKIMVDENQYYKDSLKNFYSKRISLKDTITIINEKYSTISNQNKLYSDSINKILVDYNNVKKKLVLLENKAKTEATTPNPIQDSTKIKNMITFAKIYNNANPQEVARILDNLDDSEATQILKLMQTKKASKVVEFLSPQKSAAIYKKGASFK